MESVSGLMLKGGEFIEASACVIGHQVHVSESPMENPDFQGIIFPAPVNCHTHLGDAFISPPENATVKELVAPPNGLKHRLLAEADREQQMAAMVKAIELMRKSGVSRFMDFREGGLPGINMLKKAAAIAGGEPVILGRPPVQDDIEALDGVLDSSQGIGLSAVSDIPREQLEDIARIVHGRGKIFGLHASEAVREASSLYLGLKPDVLVHMIKAQREDLVECADQGVPVVVCPRANDYFGLRPPVREMLDCGITVCLGTDNAMLASPDIFEEMRFLAGNFKLSQSEVLSIVFENGGKVLNSLPGLQATNGKGPDILAIESQLDDPWKSILGASSKNVRRFQGPE